LGERNPEAQFRGHYSSGFEHSGFAPCDGESWWTTFSGNMTSDAEGALGPDPQNEGAPSGIYMEIDGEISELGMWGHLGQYDRELVVTHMYYRQYPTTLDCE
jgi:hypothetical protein